MGREEEIERFAEIAASSLPVHLPRALLLVLDADEDCSATLGPDWTARLRSRLPAIPVGCALAIREYESRLIAGDARFGETDPESQGKRRLQDVETIDQRRLTSTLDLGRAQARSASFRHLVATVERLRRESLGQP
jgi:hypothetical protein